MRRGDIYISDLGRRIGRKREKCWALSTKTLCHLGTEFAESWKAGKSRQLLWGWQASETESWITASTLWESKWRTKSWPHNLRIFLFQRVRDGKQPDRETNSRLQSQKQVHEKEKLNCLSLLTLKMASAEWRYGHQIIANVLMTTRPSFNTSRKGLRHIRHFPKRWPKKAGA